MVKVLERKQVFDTDNNEKGIHIVGYCTSADTKPIEYANGSILLETDHEDGVKCYIFNDETKEWVAQN
jgi:hypothetical protein